MPRKASKLTIPFGLDAKVMRSRYAAMLPARKRAFAAEFERFLSLEQLRFDAAADSARTAGVKLEPLSKRSVALAKRTVATLTRFRPKALPHLLPDTPPPLLMEPPYSVSLPVNFSYSGQVDFRPWNRGPNAASGQTGGSLNTWSGGVGKATSQVGLATSVPQPTSQATYEIVVQASLIGNYYLATPHGGYAAASADLTVEFIDEFPTQPFVQSHSANLIAVAILPLFSPSPQWDYLNNTNLALSVPSAPTSSFQQTFLVTVGEAAPVNINVGVTQTVTASPGAIAGIDIEMTVQSIGFARVS